MPYKVINWEKFQARTERGSNPWVKLHRTILLSADFFAIPKARRWEWPLLLLLANHTTGIIEDSDQDIAFKLRYKDGETWNCKPFIGRLLAHMDTSGIPVATNGCLEERRVEEKREEEIDGGEPPSGTQPDELMELLRDPKTAEFYKMPLKAKNTSCYIPKSKGVEWYHTFGDSFDVPQELRKCIQWYRDNPNRRKTDAPNAVRSVGNWLRKTQNDGSGQPALSKAQVRGQRERMKRAKEADEAQAQRHQRNDNGSTPNGPEPLGVPQQEER